MGLEQLAVIDRAIGDAAMRVKRQQAYVAEFEAKGYDLGAPLTLLSCMLINLRTLERQRRDLLARIEDTVAM